MGRQTIEKVKWTCDHCGTAKETAPGDISTPLGFIEIKGTFYATEAQAIPFEGLYCSFMCASDAVKAQGQGQGMGTRRPEAGPAAVMGKPGVEAKPAVAEAKPAAAVEAKPAVAEAKPAAMEAKPAVAEAKPAEDKKEAMSPISRVRFRRR
jgi:hypothetical protein